MDMFSDRKEHILKVMEKVSTILNNGKKADCSFENIDEDIEGDLDVSAQ